MTPTRWSEFVFAAKVWGLRAVRGWQDRRDPMRGHSQGPSLSGPTCESRTALWTMEAAEEESCQLGKVQNLRTAARLLDGVVIPPGQVLSFWKQVGRPSSSAGFVPGRMLRQGCLLPSVGGGLCQLSNALFQVALEGGCEIVERHAHSRAVPGSAAAVGRDATVAWNYIDLRFRAPFDLRLEVKLTGRELIVRLCGGRKSSLPVVATVPPTAAPNRCFSCGQESCAHHARAAAMRIAKARSAFLVDENWPEFRKFVQSQRSVSDALFVPLDGSRLGVDRYRWPVSGEVFEARLATAKRSWRSRNLAGQGAERQAALLGGASELAASYARQLTPSMTELVVAQSLLPFLWKSGYLGGRVFRVLITRFPMFELQRRLDAEFAEHPELHTLQDFRAPSWIGEAEAAALASASQVVTPHAAIAGMFGQRAELLPWILPECPTGKRGNCLGFAGPVVARRGAYEVRDAARELGLPVLWSGSNFEGEDFWKGVDARHVPASELNRAAVFLAPAIVESRPQSALAAMSAGVPVIATAATGLVQREGVTIYENNLSLTRVLSLSHCRVGSK